MAGEKSMLDMLLSMSSDELDKAAELSDEELEKVFGGHDFFKPIGAPTWR